MSGLVDAIFGLEAMRFGAEGVEFGWARPLPGWLWVLAIALALGGSFWSYSRLDAPRRARAALVLVRALSLLLLVWMLAGPRLERDRSTVERDWVVGVVDRSASLGVADAGRGSRDDELRGALEAAAGSLDSIAESKRLAWLGFDVAAYELPTADGASVPGLGPPSGDGTRLGAALGAALERVRGRPVSAFVVFSDGRSDDDPGGEATRAIARAGVPVFVVPLGAEAGREDWRLRAPVSPGIAYVDDLVPVRVRIEGPASSGGTVQLIDSQTGELVASERIEAGDAALASGEPVPVVFRPGEAGDRRLEVRFVPDQPDLIAQNNTRSIAIRVVDDPIRVLHLDGAPRWEQRYLRALMLRERSIVSTSLILSADRRFQQDGNETIPRLPVTPSEWEPFDLVVVGDLRAQLMTADQLEGLRRHVTESGAGLLWLGGPGSTPMSWIGTPLEDLLPFTVPGSVELPLWDEPVTLAREPAAERLGLIELTGEGAADGADVQEYWAGRVSNPDTGWSVFRWAQRVPGEWLKPTSEIFASARPVSGADGSAAGRPLVTGMRYGSGRVAYVATDEVWRWRFGRGEALYERFWLPMIRHLARGRLERTGQRAVLSVRPEEPIRGSVANVVVELFDQSLVDIAPPSLRIAVTEPGGAEVELTLIREPGPRSRGRYSAAWTPTRTGEHRVVATDALLAALALEASPRVVPPGDELRRPQTDHATLRSIAEATGGAVVRPDQLSTLVDLLPNRERIVVGRPETADLWNRPPVFAILFVLLSVEWAVRRLIRLS